jgi:hypothetical protein
MPLPHPLLPLLFLLLHLSAVGHAAQGALVQSPCTSDLSLVVFGDFLSSPGYPGPKWPDFMQAAKVTNFASVNGQIAGDALNSSSLAGQVEEYVLQTPKGASSSTCAVVWMGSYDIYLAAAAAGATGPPSTLAVLTATEAMAQAFKDALLTLVSAKVTCVYAFTELDESVFPGISQLMAGNLLLASALDLSVTYSNSAIEETLQKLTGHGVQARKINATQAFQQALAVAQAQQPPWSEEPCFLMTPEGDPGPCTNAVWYDTMNPTPQFQQLLAQAITTQICGEPAPATSSHVPSLLWLLLLLVIPALAAVGWLLRWAVGPSPKRFAAEELASVTTGTTTTTASKDPPPVPTDGAHGPIGVDLGVSMGSTTLQPDPSHDGAALLHIGRPFSPNDSIRSDVNPSSGIQRRPTGGEGPWLRSTHAPTEAEGPQGCNPHPPDLPTWGASRAGATASHTTYTESDLESIPRPVMDLDISTMLEELLDVPVPRVEVGVHRRQGLGKGASGQVFTGTHLKKGTTVAIKVIPASPSLMDKVKQEVQRLYALRHPNIVRCFGYFMSVGNVNIVMEYVPRTLGQAIRELHVAGCMAEGVIKEYSTQILKGIAYIHGCSIVHRDLKPANILVDTHGICKIADFGCARDLIDLDASLPSCAGTPQYMAPEVMFGGNAHFGSDVWSFACIVYEMFEGQAPWHHLLENADICSAAQFFIQVSRAGGTPLRPDDQIPDSAVDFLRPCFAAAPEDRPLCPQLLGHPWLVPEAGADDDGDGAEAVPTDRGPDPAASSVSVLC